jgi:hypothetical protein
MTPQWTGITLILNGQMTISLKFQMALTQQLLRKMESFSLIKLTSKLVFRISTLLITEMMKGTQEIGMTKMTKVGLVPMNTP